MFLLVPSHRKFDKVLHAQMFLVEQHIPTADPITKESIGEPFTGSDIRRVVYTDFVQERAEQYADVANRVNSGIWCTHYTVRAVFLEFD